MVPKPFGKPVSEIYRCIGISGKPCLEVRCVMSHIATVSKGCLNACPMSLPTQLKVAHETVTLTRPGHVRFFNLCAHAVLVST